MSDSAAAENRTGFTGGFYSRDTFRRKESLILVLQTGLAGGKYFLDVNGNPDDRLLLESLKKGSELKLFRDVGNEYDEWAILVSTPEGRDIGHITRFKNETIARLMDEGKEFRAYVGEKPEEPESEEERQRRFAPTERFDVPIDIFMVESD